MANICPLLLRPSFLGRTYHDFQLNFEYPSTNCTVNSEQNQLIIQFTRMINSTFNQSSYSFYDLTKNDGILPHFQVFHDDHINLCIRSGLSSNVHHESCHEFYMITMLSENDRIIWPLLIILGYFFILLLAMLFSLFSQLFEKLSQTLFSGSITKKLVKNRHFRSFLPLTERYEQKHHLKKIDEKKKFLRIIDSIANECQPNRNTFIISTEHDHGQINSAYF